MKTVYIDAGHGGKDPGAVSGGINEKDITLEVSKIVCNQLKSYGVNVVLTRDCDETVSLNQRTESANDLDADIFVSIHCNSYSNVNSKGIETYCYKFKYSKLADVIHKKIVENTSLFSFDRGVKEGDFHVLRQTKMPACLVELGFISNKTDRERLLTKQVEYATAITEGILCYLEIDHYVAEKPQIEESNKPLYHVIIGELESEDEANKILKMLKEQKLKNVMKCVTVD